MVIFTRANLRPPGNVDCTRTYFSSLKLNLPELGTLSCPRGPKLLHTCTSLLSFLLFLIILDNEYPTVLSFTTGFFILNFRVIRLWKLGKKKDFPISRQTCVLYKENYRWRIAFSRGEKPPDWEFIALFIASGACHRCDCFLFTQTALSNIISLEITMLVAFCIPINSR